MARAMTRRAFRRLRIEVTVVATRRPKDVVVLVLRSQLRPEDDGFIVLGPRAQIRAFTGLSRQPRGIGRT